MLTAYDWARSCPSANFAIAARKNEINHFNGTPNQQAVADIFSVLSGQTHLKLNTERVYIMQ